MLRIVFQGDSITDAGRDRSDIHHLGYGYARFAAENLTAGFPELEFDFINQGISGERTDQLFARIYTECIAYEPDIVSVLIGINDIWQRFDEVKRVYTTDEQIAANLRATLSRIKREANAKLAVFLPYVLDAEDKQKFRPDLERLIPTMKAISAEYADVVVPLDELFAEAMKAQPNALYYSGDGIHPNEQGARFIAKHYFDAVAPLVAGLVK